jgi:hypothetical protein
MRSSLKSEFGHLLYAAFGYPEASLALCATSPIVPSAFLFAFRVLALAYHLSIIGTGVYTRRLRFFVQFTNMTNIASTVYFTLACRISGRYRRSVAASRHDPSERHYRHRPSRIAATAFNLLQVVAALMWIVTVVFWVLLVPVFRTDHGWIDWYYGIGAHGVTLVLLMIELSLTRIPFTRRAHRHTFAALASYTTFGGTIGLATGFYIYPFLNLHDRRNWPLMPVVMGAGALFHELNITFVRLRDFLFSRTRAARVSTWSAHKDLPAFSETAEVAASRTEAVSTDTLSTLDLDSTRFDSSLNTISASRPGTPVAASGAPATLLSGRTRALSVAGIIAATDSGRSSHPRAPAIHSQKQLFFADDEFVQTVQKKLPLQRKASPVVVTTDVVADTVMGLMGPAS